MLRKLLAGLVAVAALVLVSLQPAAAQQRIALVIGNAAYPKGPLQTSLADGGLIAEALTSIGFEIVEGADVNSNDMRRVFGDFLAKVNAAGPDTIAFIYYNGYAVQFEGDNYLVPVDAQLNRDSDIPIQGVRLFDLLRPLADAPAKTKIVVLDAARPLPFQIQGQPIAPGLGAIESSPGMLVAFSSAPGTVAQDGPGPYGPYATAIAEMVREPGLDIDTLFARIRLRTNEATQGAQTPWEVSQLQTVVMLVPGQAAAPPPGAQGFLAAPQTQVGAPVVRRRAPPRPIQDIGPEEAYAYAVEADDLPTYSEYVRVYPNSAYTPRVWAMIRARREALVWRHALLANTPDAYWTYIDRYPEGMYGFDARRRLRRLSAGDRPPPGWRMMDFDDVPPPLAGEPARFIDVLPPAPPPRRWLAPPPAFIVGLPPPPRPGGGGGLWRREQPVLPVIIAPPQGGRPGFQGGGRPPGPPSASVPPGPPPGGGIPPGFQGPPKQWQKPGTGIGNAPPGGPGGGVPKGPAVVNQPPAGGPPPGFQGPPKQWQKPGTGIGNAPPGGPGSPPKVVNQPPGGAPSGFQGPPKQWQKPSTGIGNAPPGPPQGAPKVVNQPPGPPSGGTPSGFQGPPKQWQKPGTGIGSAPPKPPSPPPQVRVAPPTPPSPPPQTQMRGGPPPQLQKGPPQGGAKGLPKCAATGGKQPCAP